MLNSPIRLRFFFILASILPRLKYIENRFTDFEYEPEIVENILNFLLYLLYWIEKNNLWQP